MYSLHVPVTDTYSWKVGTVVVAGFVVEDGRAYRIVSFVEHPVVRMELAMELDYAKNVVVAGSLLNSLEGHWAQKQDQDLHA
jgi:hypothetical protein